MARLLNEIISLSGAAVVEGPVTGDEIRDWMTDDLAIWHVAEGQGEIDGFQWIEPRAGLPVSAVSIATFTSPSHQGVGIASALFEVTKRVAKSRGIQSIHATIAADNDRGLAYYRSRGFEPHRTTPTGHMVVVYRI